MKTNHNLGVELRYVAYDREIDVREFSGIFGENEREKEVSTSSRVVKDVLWDADLLLADFSGPELKRAKISTRNAYGKSFQVTSKTERRSVLGIPMGRSYESSINTREPGAVLTAISAYATKLAGVAVTPRVDIPYTGPVLGDMDAWGRISCPFGVDGLTGLLEPDRIGYSRVMQPVLFAMGSIGLRGAAESDLPEIMTRQTLALSRASGDETFASLALAEAYGGSHEAVATVWAEAIARPGARQAAEHVLAYLG